MFWFVFLFVYESSKLIDIYNKPAWFVTVAHTSSIAILYLVHRTPISVNNLIRSEVNHRCEVMD